MQFIRYPSSSFNSSAVGTIGLPIPTAADLVGFRDPSGNLIYGNATATGDIIVAPASSSGRSLVDSVYNDYGTTNVTTAAWVQLIAATAGVINQVQTYDTSGEAFEIGIGAIGLETLLFYMPRGGNGEVNVTIPAGSRISIRAKTGNATTAGTDLIMNLFS